MKWIDRFLLTKSVSDAQAVFSSLSPEESHAALQDIRKDVSCTMPEYEHVWVAVLDHHHRRTTKPEHFPYHYDVSRLFGNKTLKHVPEMVSVFGHIWATLISHQSVLHELEFCDQRGSFLSWFSVFSQKVTPEDLHCLFPLFDQIVQDLQQNLSVLKTPALEQFVSEWPQKSTLPPDLVHQAIKQMKLGMERKEASNFVLDLSLKVAANKECPPQMWDGVTSYSPETKKHLIRLGEEFNVMLPLLGGVEEHLGIEMVRSMGVKPSHIVRTLIFDEENAKKLPPSKVAQMHVVDWFSDPSAITQLVVALQCADAFKLYRPSKIVDKIKQDLKSKMLKDHLVAPLYELHFGSNPATPHHEVGLIKQLLINFLENIFTGDWEPEAIQRAQDRLDEWGDHLHPTLKAFIGLVYESQQEPQINLGSWDPAHLPQLEGLKDFIAHGTNPQRSPLSAALSNLESLYTHWVDRNHLLEHIQLPATSSLGRKM